MKQAILVILLLICVWGQAPAQISNYVRNPDLEEYSTCPDMWNQLVRALHWSMPIDTIGEANYAPEFFNICTTDASLVTLPANSFFYQQPHSGNGIAGCGFFYDKTTPPPGIDIPFDYRDYLQGRLYAPLKAGKSYCVSFWVNMAEASGYAIDKIGAYLDDGSINKLSLAPGTEITSVMPQVYSRDQISDTAGWVKIEGSFVAKGGERYITIGNFFKNSDVRVLVTNYWIAYTQDAYYLIDDISVVESDSKAYAGPDNWVPQGSSVSIGRVGDTTARGMNCYWYCKGKLTDSGAVIAVPASALAYAVDTYVVVQEVCGYLTRDTVLVRTVPSGVATHFLSDPALTFHLFPNPSNGAFEIASTRKDVSGEGQVKLYDMMGKLCLNTECVLQQGRASIKLPAALPNGHYLLQLRFAGQTYLLRLQKQ